MASGSWLNLTRLLEFRGLLFWEQFDYPTIEESDEDIYIQLSQGQAERVDLLAHDFYGDSELWWIILLANDIEFPNQLREGLTIRIPARTTVETILKPKT